MTTDATRATVSPDQRGEVARTYRVFGETQARHSSACFERWTLAIAEDDAVLGLVATLPPAKRQPNLVLAAARWHGVEPGPYAVLRSALLERWPEISSTVLARSTQTNEAARCATILPVLAAIPGPVALVEVGASAGLCLLPDRYGYAYRRPDGSVTELEPADGPSPVTLRCEVDAETPLPDRLPEIVWRAGVDLHPLDVADPDATAWLETLVWPEHEERRQRLRSATTLARRDPPRVVEGDALEVLPALLDEAPAEATVVVQHSAALAYLSREDQDRLVALVRSRGARLLGNEGHGTVGHVRAPAPSRSDAFVVSLDGRPQAYAGPHGQWLEWIR